MDLESERSVTEVLGENGEIDAKLKVNFGENDEIDVKLKDDLGENGEIDAKSKDKFEENGEIDTKLKDNGKYDAEKVDNKNLLDDSKASPLAKTELLSSSSTPATKGRGLRKWRRIRRDSGKDTSGGLDSNRKRGLIGVPVDMKPSSEGSSSSTNAMSVAHGKALDRSSLYGDLGRGPAFGSAAREDSENSEDRNSRSATAASAPRANHEIPFVGLGLDMNTMRTLSGMNSRVTVGDQQEKGRNATKKARGVKLKKENSYSSMESDSRSSNFVFAQGTNSTTSNGRQSGRSANYDEDLSDDAQNGDRHINEETQIAFSKNEADSEDVSHEDLAAENSWGVKEEIVDDRVGSGGRDALVECIMPLHLAQEALEREVQKLKDVGKEYPLFSDDLVQPSVSSFTDEDIQSTKIIRKQNDTHLQTNLDEAQIMLELKDATISKLECTLNLADLKTEHDELLMQRIAAEVEYLVISKTVQNLKVDHIDRINLTSQQKNLAEPKEMQHEDSDGKDAYKLRNMVYRYTSCLSVQLVLLLVVVYLFVFKFGSQTIEVMPT